MTPLFGKRLSQAHESVTLQKQTPDVDTMYWSFTLNCSGGVKIPHPIRNTFKFRYANTSTLARFVDRTAEPYWSGIYV